MSANMAEQQEKIHPESTKYWETGAGTKDDPEISFLVFLCVENPWKNELAINVAYEGAKNLGAIKIRIRHTIHNTTRGVNNAGITMRYKTDWHITVYIWIPEVGHWQHGDIFYTRRGRVGCRLMKDVKRRDTGGQGIELWTYPEDENRQNLTRDQRNQRLAQAIEEGRWCQVVVYKEVKNKQIDSLAGVDDGDYEDDQPSAAPTQSGNLQVGGDAVIGGGLAITGSSQIGGNAHVDLDSRVAGDLTIGKNSYTGGNVRVGSVAALTKVYPLAWHNPTWGPSKVNTDKHQAQSKSSSNDSAI